MHQRQRRLYCRILFVALCVLPTCAVVAWAAARRMPGYAAAHATQLAAYLGTEVRIARVEHPRPGQVRYRGLELIDPENRRTIARCRVVDLFDTGDSWQIEAAQPEVDARGAERLWHLVQRRLRRELPGEVRSWQFVATELAWHHGELSQSFVEVDGYIAGSDTADEAQVSFRLAGSNSTSPVVLRLVRRKDPSQPRMGISVDSAGSTLPAHLLAPLFDGRHWLGSRARFRGYLWIDETATGWRGELAGSLSEVDLQRVVAAQFPHVLAGAAEIEIERAILEQGRLEEASGTIIAGPGQVGRSLVFAGCQHLGLGDGTAPLPAQSVAVFDRLAFDFALRDGQLALRGRCPGDETAMLVAGGQAFWRQPATPQPVAGLIRALVAEGNEQLPATREGQWLASRLPLPRSAPGDGPNESPRVHVKLGNTVPETE